jgi:hypothetical protein
MLRKEAQKLGKAFIKYRNGQIHLFDFKNHAGISVGEAIIKHPWLKDVYFEKDILPKWEKHEGRSEL